MKELYGGEVLANGLARRPRIAKTHLGCGGKKGPNGDTVSETLREDYRIHYCLPSEKLKPVN